VIDGQIESKSKFGAKVQNGERSRQVIDCLMKLNVEIEFQQIWREEISGVIKRGRAISVEGDLRGAVWNVLNAIDNHALWGNGCEPLAARNSELLNQ
jgi:hypothetical protein